jgi:TonB family protein
MTRVIVISAIVHVVLVVLLPFAPRLTSPPEPAYEVYSVELVDVVEATPAPAVEQTVEPPPEVETPVEEEAPVEDEPQIPEEPVRQTRRIVTTPPPRQERSLAERLQERLTPETEPEPEERPRAQAEEPEPTARTTVKASRFPYAWYLSIVQGKVKSNWKQPSSVLFGERELSAVVSFRIMRDGSVGPVTVRRSSGRATLDQSAAKAVQASTPFPPLPNDYLEDHLDVTIDFTVAR